LVVLGFSFEFKFEGFIKMIFSNKVASTMASLFGTILVLDNGGIG
jgi:hypothetical protein